MSDPKTISSVVVLVAIVTIGVLEAVAITHGVDGSGFGIVIAAIAGLGGFTVRSALPPDK